MIYIEIQVNYSLSIQKYMIYPTLSDDLQGIWKIFRKRHSKALYYHGLKKL